MPPLRPAIQRSFREPGMDGWMRRRAVHEPPLRTEMPPGSKAGLLLTASWVLWGGFASRLSPEAMNDSLMPSLGPAIQRSFREPGMDGRGETAGGSRTAPIYSDPAGRQTRPTSYGFLLPRRGANPAPSGAVACERRIAHTALLMAHIAQCLRLRAILLAADGPFSTAHLGQRSVMLPARGSKAADATRSLPRPGFRAGSRGAAHPIPGTTRWG